MDIANACIMPKPQQVHKVGPWDTDSLVDAHSLSSLAFQLAHRHTC